MAGALAGRAGRPRAAARAARGARRGRPRQPARALAEAHAGEGGKAGEGEGEGGLLGVLLEPVAAHEPSNPSAALYNDDLRPVLAGERTFGTLDLAALWVGIVVCVPAYILAANLVQLGMSWLTAVGTVLCANVVVLVPMVLNGHVGTKYGVPFPVAARAAFGIKGANVPSLLRAAVATGWFGIQTWLGGEALGALGVMAARATGASSFAAALSAPVAALGITVAEAAGFAAFWALQVAIIVRGVESIRWMERLTAPVLIALVGSLLVWACTAAGGLGAALAATKTVAAGSATYATKGFWGVFWPALTANISFWATLSLNIPDFTRFAHSQRSQLAGQALGLPFSMAALSFVGVAATGASLVLFGGVVADPVQLIARACGTSGGVAPALALVGLLVATLSTNIAANVVGPAYALVNAAPRALTFASSGVLTALVGALMQPWRLVASTEGFIFTWLIGYSALLGPVAGIMIADYWLLRRRALDVDALFDASKSGAYYYSGGYNGNAVTALVLGALPSVPGFAVAAGAASEGTFPTWALAPYDHAWTVGFVVAAGIYLALSGASRAATQPTAAA